LKYQHPASDQFRKGLLRALKLKNISQRQASLQAGYNENMLNHFITNGTDIKLVNLARVCDSIGFDLLSVFELGRDID